MGTSGKPPDFVIAGAPRCGTTALYTYLSQHPDIFLPKLKEPHYFAPEIGSLRRVRDEAGYFELYRSAKKDQIRGDGSVWYLQSETAIPSLLQHQPDARFVIMLRHPADFLASVHQTLLLTGVEKHQQLKTAWQAQEMRSGPSDSRLLQYLQLASFGSQIQRLQDLVGGERVLVHLLEDLREDPAAVYRHTLDFLEVDDDGRREFPVVNERIGYRNNRLGQLFQRLPEPLANLRVRLQNAADSEGEGIISSVATRARSLSRRNWKPAEASQLDASLREAFLEELDGDITLLEQLLERPLGHWRE